MIDPGLYVAKFSEPAEGQVTVALEDYVSKSGKNIIYMPCCLNIYKDNLDGEPKMIHRNMMFDKFCSVMLAVDGEPRLVAVEQIAKCFGITRQDVFRINDLCVFNRIKNTYFFVDLIFEEKWNATRIRSFRRYSKLRQINVANHVMLDKLKLLDISNPLQPQAGPEIKAIANTMHNLTSAMVQNQKVELPAHTPEIIIGLDAVDNDPLPF